MTCIECKYYFPYKHKHDDKLYQGICRYEPETFHKNENMWCGKFKNKMVKTRKAKALSDYSKEFVAFWDVYPKKMSKDTAWKAWSDPDVILPEYYALITERARSYAQVVVSEAKDMQYVKHPSTWLRAGDWKTKTEKKKDTKSCIDCGASYKVGHKYIFENGQANKNKYRCEECREKIKANP